MDERLLEIRHFSGKGYQTLIDFNTWRVAILRWEDTSPPGNIESMERHTQTDEVFVLLEGEATLVLGGNAAKVDGIYSQKLEPCKLYNVKQNAWHTALLSHDVSILLVENCDTGVENTEYCDLSEEQRQAIMALSKNG
jgi:ureidoglycolate hydrolase